MGRNLAQQLHLLQKIEDLYEIVSAGDAERDVAKEGSHRTERSEVESDSELPLPIRTRGSPVDMKDAEYLLRFSGTSFARPIWSLNFSQMAGWFLVAFTVLRESFFGT